ncbi:hypothetical protein D3C71_1553210 [compost metagenome]
MLGLVAVQPDPANILLQLLERNGQVILRRLVLAEQVLGDLVHRRIRALGRQQNRNRQLKRVAVVQLALRIREHIADCVQNMSDIRNLHRCTSHITIVRYKQRHLTHRIA